MFNLALWSRQLLCKINAHISLDNVCRYICEKLNGSPPTPEHEAAHSCGKGHLGCVNGSHLRWDTHRGNMADMIIHGTVIRGEPSLQSKLTERQISQIKSMQNTHTHTQLAKLFGVTQVTITRIINDKNMETCSKPSCRA
jgi:hypothetical protein